MEEVLKFKHRLFCNIKFVGELNKRDLLAESIVISVFDMLICLKETDEERIKERMSDDTVEGACILMNKIGHIIDERIKKEEQKEKPTANLKRLLEYNDVFKRFEDLRVDKNLSLRV